MNSTPYLAPPSQTRLVTIVAHVDHGKTSLADNLIQHNGIISERLAGTLRYLDFDPEEQRRGITMRTSAILLQHLYDDKKNKKKNKDKKQQQQSSPSETAADEQQQVSPIPMSIHLADSPGHSDFALEVSSSLWTCDSALIVVDVVEGMGARTHQVLRETMAHRLIPVLVLNKIDRLSSQELCLTPTEAYLRLRELLESVNAAAAAMIASTAASATATTSVESEAEATESEKASNTTTTTTKTAAQSGLDINNSTNLEELEQLWVFEPSKGNVVFASALYGMGFTVWSLAKSLFQQKVVPIKPALLQPYLFGDYKLGNQDKIFKWTQHSSDDQPPLFAQFALAPLWSIFDAVGTAAAASLSSTKSSLLPATAAASTYSNNAGKLDLTLTSTSSSSSSLVEELFTAMSVGSTAPKTVSTSTLVPDLSSLLLLPSTASELQKLLQHLAAKTPESILRAVLRRYRPLSWAVLDVISSYCPSPVMAQQPPSLSPPPSSQNLQSPQHSTTPQQQRQQQHHLRSKLFEMQVPSTSQASSNALTNNHDDSLEQLQAAIYQCDPDSPLVVAQVCKFVSTDITHLQDPELSLLLSRTSGAVAVAGGGATPTAAAPVLLGLTRVLCGTLQTGAEYYVFGHASGKAGSSSAAATLSSSTTSPESLSEQTTAPNSGSITTSPVMKRTIRVYLLLGSSFVLVDRVPAGHICAVFNLETTLLKTATLCNVPYGQPLVGAPSQRNQPLVKVQVEPVHASDSHDLEQGLLKLALADASVDVSTTARGETMLACCGELHLEQSIVDLQKMIVGSINSSTGQIRDKMIQVRISDPIVEFGETTDWMTDKNEVEQFSHFYDCNAPPVRQVNIPPYNEEEGLAFAKHGRMRSLLSGRGAAIRLRVVPLLPDVHKSILDQKLVAGSEPELLKLGRALKCNKNATAQDILDVLSQYCLCCLPTNGTAMVESPGLREGICVCGIASDENGEVYVPHQAAAKEDPGAAQGSGGGGGGGGSSGSNSTLVGKDEFHSLRDRIHDTGFQTSLSSVVVVGNHTRSPADEAAFDIWSNEMKGSAVAGFQLAVRAGPICEEPVRNILVILEGVEIAVQQQRQQQHHHQQQQQDAQQLEQNAQDNGAKEEEEEQVKAQEHGPLSSWRPSKPLSSGMVVAALRTGVRCALLTRPARLMEGILRLTLHSSLSGLGALYSVLSKRRGKVVQDSMVDGTDLLLIEALIPQAEAFGLAPELFGKTSGEVTAPEMIFSHWERLDVDPFWIPTSLEEREDFGELMVAGDSSTGLDNTALNYIRKVRQRKGLFVDSSRTVVAAEKQRTLKR